MEEGEVRRGRSTCDKRLTRGLRRRQMRLAKGNRSCATPTRLNSTPAPLLATSVSPSVWLPLEPPTEGGGPP